MKINKLLVLGLAAVSLAGCSSGAASRYPGLTELHGYALSHNYYVSEGIVWVKKVDGKWDVQAAEIKEWFLPTHHAGVTSIKVAGVDYAVETFAGEGGTNVTGQSKDLLAWLVDGANAKKYVEALKNGKVEYTDAEGTHSSGDHPISDWYKDAVNYGHFGYSATGSWGSVFNHSTNYGAIAHFAIEHEDLLTAARAELTLNASYRFTATAAAGFTQVAVDGTTKTFWAIDGVAIHYVESNNHIGATASDTAQYWQALARAYVQAK